VVVLHRYHIVGLDLCRLIILVPGELEHLLEIVNSDSMIPD
jgi:hypothetical protein